jgi:hypothetical protein
MTAPTPARPKPSTERPPVLVNLKAFHFFSDLQRGPPVFFLLLHCHPKLRIVSWEISAVVLLRSLRLNLLRRLAGRSLQFHRLDHYPELAVEQHLGPNRHSMAECPHKIQISEVGRCLHHSGPNSQRRHRPRTLELGPRRYPHLKGVAAHRPWGTLTINHSLQL